VVEGRPCDADRIGDVLKGALSVALLVEESGRLRQNVVGDVL
jgi:hypothetical protein